MITVDRLYVRYDDTNILEDINLNLPTGITCAVIGPSGCGKSTLLNVLAGLQKNYQGLVQINGENPSPKKQTIGFIPQNYGLLPWLAQLGIPAFLHMYFDLFSGAIQTFVFAMLTMTFITDKREA